MNPPVDLQHSQALRAALGRYATGVAIITCQGQEGAPVGLTANSFSALSLQPPLVLWSLRLDSPSQRHFSAASHFAVNVLAQEQLDLAKRFSRPAPDKFAEGRWSAGTGQAPVLDGACAVFECQAHSQQLAGDHVLFIGQLVKADYTHAAPLLFQASHYRSLGGPV